MPRALPLFLGLTLTAVLSVESASQGQPKNQGPDTAPPAWIALEVYTEPQSRRAFAACDRDGDDRLSILEAARAIDGIDTGERLDAFRRLDGNANGFLEWPEFDRRFRELSDRGLAMRIRPARSLELAPKKDKPSDPEAAKVADLTRLLDRDHDNVISLEEARRVPSDLTLPAEFGHSIAVLDADQSGTLSPDELLPLARLLRSSPAAVTSEGSLPEGYRAADTNGDGVLTAVELESVLRKLDPSLVRWSKQIVRDADRSGNETLGPAEVLGAGK